MTSLGRSFAGLAHELSRRDNSARDKALRVAQRSVHALSLSPHVHVSRRIIVDLNKPPKDFRGLRDLVIRRGGERDVDALVEIDDTPRALVHARLARGDLAYVADLEGEILGHTWFHRGPSPFDEDRGPCVRWALADATFWSYNGAAREAARSSGVFVKLFQNALRDVFETHGGRRIQGFIHDTNQPSLTMHERMGFANLGALTTIALPGVKWLHWHGGDGATRQWLVRRDSPLALTLPPIRTSRA